MRAWGFVAWGLLASGCAAPRSATVPAPVEARSLVRLTWARIDGPGEVIMWASRDGALVESGATRLLRRAGAAETVTLDGERRRRVTSRDEAVEAAVADAEAFAQRLRAPGPPTRLTVTRTGRPDEAAGVRCEWVHAALEKGEADLCVGAWDEEPWRAGSAEHLRALTRLQLREESVVHVLGGRTPGLLSDWDQLGGWPVRVRSARGELALTKVETLADVPGLFVVPADFTEARP